MSVKDTPILQVPDNKCEHIDTCALFPLFSSKGAAGLYKLHYCYSDYEQCARHKMSRLGRPPPLTLLPDGTSLRAKKK